ncbi:MAG: FlgD immunoglobulin-like domain containing protein [Fibrobacterota bacterium]
MPIQSRLFFVFALGFAFSAFGLEYQQEWVFDSTVHSDEAAVNVSLCNNQYPNCYSLQTAIQDIFRLENAQTENQKALSLYKWFTSALFSSGTGGYAYENGSIPYDPAKLLNVYGWGACDQGSWALVGLWRAAGYIAYDECSYGHTIAALRYRDADGQMRMHDCDQASPQRLYWNAANNCMRPISVPIMRGMIYRHYNHPQTSLRLRTSLKIGETVERRWFNNNHVLQTASTLGSAVPGEEQQIYIVDTAAATYQRALYEGSQNTAQSPAASGSATLHPATPNQLSTFIYRMASPYVGVNCTLRVTLVKTDPSDVCRIMLSRDSLAWKTRYDRSAVGVTWETLYDKTTTGEETITLVPRYISKFGANADTSAYTFFIKAEFQTAGTPSQTGLNAMTIAAYRQLNARALPRLRSGNNYLKVNADSILPGYGLRVQMKYSYNSQPYTVVDTFNQFPSYFKISVAGKPTMTSYQMTLVPFSGVRGQNDSMEAQFHIASPLGASETLAYSIVSKAMETNVRQVSGFFPQDTVHLSGLPTGLIYNLFRATAENRWFAAETLGYYPAAVDTLCYALLHTANWDQATFIMKALAQIGDPKALPSVLNYWQNFWELGAYNFQEAGPAMRYVPDVLAVIGDSSVVPALMSKFPLCRCDYRLHIAHALGHLGGSQAFAVLQDMIVNDPYPAVREEAQLAMNYLLQIEKPAPRRQPGGGVILFPNYPNPFNPTTTLSFQVPEGMGRNSGIKIGVYNTSGSLIRNLFSGERAPGAYTLQWNSRDDANQSVSSGIYIFKMETAGQVLEKKATLMK